jgi:uncharacterized protein (DUF2126 family)
MLPHFVEQDFNDVMEEMQQAGYPFKAEWFAPHFEFRFPKSAISRSRASSSNCATPSNPGT